MPLDLPRLRATLGQPELTRLLDALVRRLTRGRALTGGLTLPVATQVERNAADAWLGRKTSRGDTLYFDLDVLAETLAAAGICDNLREGVEALRGPVDDGRASALARTSAWATVRAESRAGYAPWPVLCEWHDELFATGLLKRLANDPAHAAQLLAEVAHLAAALPVRAEPVAALAARLYGDAHALDVGPPRATLGVRAAALLGGVELEDDAEGRRTAWASVGVVLDELSTPALVFNLPLRADTPPARLARAALADAEPVHLTLRALLLHPLSADPALAGLEVFVCENPTIVALAARRLGPLCAPLVCVNGQFATPVKILLRQLAAAGARLCYHGDFDVGGLVIARRVMRDHGATPWRMGEADYLAAPKGLPIPPGAVLSSPWGPALAEAMQRERRTVHEEVLHELLLADLSGTHGSGGRGEVAEEN